MSLLIIKVVFQNWLFKVRLTVRFCFSVYNNLWLELHFVNDDDYGNDGVDDDYDDDGDELNKLLVWQLAYPSSS